MVYINETLLKLQIRRGLKRLKRPDLEPWAYLRCKQSHKKKVVQRRNHCCYSRNRCRHIAYCVFTTKCFYRRETAESLAAACSSLKGHWTFHFFIHRPQKISSYRHQSNCPSTMNSSIQPFTKHVLCQVSDKCYSPVSFIWIWNTLWLLEVNNITYIINHRLVKPQIECVCVNQNWLWVNINTIEKSLLCFGHDVGPFWTLCRFELITIFDAQTCRSN